MSSPENRLVVVNMAKWPSDFSEHRMYCCPCTEHGFDASYRHYPAKYIGNYVNKGVKYIGVVAACVRLKASGHEVLWKFDDISDDEAIARAEIVRKATRRNPWPCLVLLQSQLTATDFEYDHAGGPQGSRYFFDLEELAPTDVKDLAAKLRVTPWSTLRKFEP